MKTLLKGSILITIAAGFVIMGTLGIAQTDWADQARSRGPQQHRGEFREGDGFAASHDPGDRPGGRHRDEHSGVIGYIGPLVKPIVAMGIPALLTVLLARAGRRLSTWRQSKFRGYRTSSSG